MAAAGAPLGADGLNASIQQCVAQCGGGPELADLLGALLQLDPRRRVSAKALVRHPYFAVADPDGANLNRLQDRLPEMRAHVLGHHTGASIAASLAARHPDRVDRLILNGVPLLSDEERAFFATFKFAPVVPRADGGHLTDAWNQRLQATPGWSDLAAMHRHVATMLANPKRYFWAFEAVFAHDLAADLAAITAPTLVLTNSGEDLFAASARASGSRPDWRFAALDGGTHDIVDEQSEAWAAAVIDFLAAPAPDKA